MNVNLSAEQIFLEKMTGIIEAHLSDWSFGVSELSREMGISHSHLHRKLKAIVNQSISQFIRETRLKHAMELLSLQAGTVAEIAYGVGFSSTTYFTKCFHDHFGYPPGEVKKRFHSGSDSPEEQKIKDKQAPYIHSVVVLPFDNYSGDEDQTYLVFGIHDALITELGQLESLRVISKTSTLSYLNSSKTIGEIASDFNVDAIIEGSILCSDNILRLNLKIIRAFPEEKQIWTKSFEMSLRDLLKLYSEVTKNIADEIQLKLSPEKLVRFDQTREVNAECYKAYLRGKYCLFQLTPEGVIKGLEYLHQAVLIDPAEPFAYAALAQGYLDTTHGPINPENAYEKAESAISQAMRLDKSMPEILTVQAEICMYITWKFNQAERYYKRSLELNPNLSWTHYHYSWALYLFGRNEEAVKEHELALKCDPFHPYITALTGALYSYVGQYEKSLQEALKSLDMIKDFPYGYWVLGETYLALKEDEKAIQAHEKLAALAPEWNWRLGETYALTGHREKAEKILKELENGPIVSWTAMGLAALYGAMGEYDLAFKWLTYEPHHAWIPWVAVMPMWASLYNDPRYNAFVKRFKLPR